MSFKFFKVFILIKTTRYVNLPTIPFTNLFDNVFFFLFSGCLSDVEMVRSCNYNEARQLLVVY